MTSAKSGQEPDLFSAPMEALKSFVRYSRCRLPSLGWYRLGLGIILESLRIHASGKGGQVVGRTLGRWLVVSILLVVGALALRYVLIGMPPGMTEAARQDQEVLRRRAVEQELEAAQGRPVELERRVEQEP